MLLYYEDDERIVMLDLAAKQLDHILKIENEQIVKTSKTFPNALILSEAFRDDVGLTLAKKILAEHNVDARNEIWNLGAKGGETNAPKNKEGN